MIKICRIDELHKQDVNLKNEPFTIFGKLNVTYLNGKWDYTVQSFPEEMRSELRFPDEEYDYYDNSFYFLGAYDNDDCIGLAVLQRADFRYIYLYDLKVNRNYRNQGVARLLIEKAKEVASANGYNGIYTIAQDNNVAACKFYLKNGFTIGGLDTNVYRGTPQEHKSDVILYLDCAD